jgi:hypothetical protein
MTSRLLQTYMSTSLIDYTNFAHREEPRANWQVVVR